MKLNRWRVGTICVTIPLLFFLLGTSDQREYLRHQIKALPPKPVELNSSVRIAVSTTARQHRCDEVNQVEAPTIPEERV